MRIDLKKANLSVLRALAVQISFDIDRGDDSNSDLLEEVFSLIPKAKEFAT